jgi:5-methylthioadenosine/S-adenosylhomocysteine deaminase
MAREQLGVSKLIAIGGAMEQESFEIQTKVRITDSEPVLAALHSPEIEIVRQRHYREYDTYFSFDDPGQGYLRFREDHFIGDDGEVNQQRTRPPDLIGAPEFNFPKQQVLLSRSSYYAPANHSLRFYREYFKPAASSSLKRIACASWYATKTQNSLSTSILSKNRPWASSWKSKAAPGAGKMPTIKQPWQQSY